MKRYSLVAPFAVALLALAGAAPAPAGEGVAAGTADMVIRAAVTRVVEKDGKLAVTVMAGKADGIREGFELTCRWKDWTGKVVSVAEDSAVLEVGVELKAKVAVRDLAETKLTTVLAEVKPGGKPPEPAPVKADAVEGLQLVLVKRENVTKMMGFVDKDGNPLRVRPGQGPPEGAVEKAVETKHPELVARLTNVSDKTIVLGCNRTQWGLGWATAPIRLSARDAEGKEVPRNDMGWGGAPAADRTGPPDIVILKPGQSLEQSFQWMPLQFPADAKYTVGATFEDQPRPEVLPGITPWSGKLKSNEIEWEGKVMKAWGGGGPWGGPQPGGPATPAPNPPAGKEVF
jgi:hypothetical protein